MVATNSGVFKDELAGLGLAKQVIAFVLEKELVYFFASLFD